MTPTETRYAQIEKEALSVTWACDRFAEYLIGMEFEVQTDHKPLVLLLRTKELEDLPPRILRFRLRLMRYQFSIYHVPGKDLTIADALSRAPSSEATEEDLYLKEEVEAYVSLVLQSIPATERCLEEIRRHQREDELIQRMAVYCQSGWPQRGQIPDVLKPYYPVAAELTMEDGILMRGQRIVIAASLRMDILEKLHEGHQGIVKCRERARQSVWWPGLSRRLEELVKSCPECCKHKVQRPQPLQPSETPQLPWQKVATDLFQWKKSSYLLVVDYYSRWIEVARLTSETSEAVIEHMSSIFARHGIPEIVVSDNGPQYTSDAFAKFARVFGFYHVTSSPHYPQGNGEAERAVQTVKSLLNKTANPYLALLEYRATPLQDGYSPAELLMSRRLRTTLPMARQQRVPKVVNVPEFREKEKQGKERQCTDFNRHRGARELSPLQPGDEVWIPDRQSNGQVVEEANPRSVIVATPEGTFRRNQRHLNRLPEDDSEEHNVAV